MKTLSNKSYLLIGSLVLAMAVALLLWNFHERKQKPSVLPVPAVLADGAATDAPPVVSLTSEAMARAGIGVMPVTMRNFSSQISAVGILEIPDPAERTIAAYARGRIEKMYVASTGAYVHKGEPLFEFYSPDILAAEKDYLIAAGIGDMDKNMMAKNPGMEHHSDPGLLKAGKERLLLYGLTPEQVDQLVENLKVTNTVTITSPMDGVILQKLSQDGAYVEEGTSIFQLADLSSLWAEVDVPENDIRFIRMGQIVNIQTAAYP